jgi:hypothetical protein
MKNKVWKYIYIYKKIIFSYGKKIIILIFFFKFIEVSLFYWKKCRRLSFALLLDFGDIVNFFGILDEILSQLKI